MSQIKSILQNKLISPANKMNQSTTSIAKIIKSDETTNMCSVSYIDKAGFNSNRDNVPVKIYGGNTEWFPAIDDLVIVEDDGSLATIVSKHVGNYNMDVKSKTKLTKDIHSDLLGSICGFIF